MNRRHPALLLELGLVSKSHAILSPWVRRSHRNPIPPGVGSSVDDPQKIETPISTGQTFESLDPPRVRSGTFPEDGPGRGGDGRRCWPEQPEWWASLGFDSRKPHSCSAWKARSPAGPRSWPSSCTVRTASRWPARCSRSRGRYLEWGAPHARKVLGRRKGPSGYRGQPGGVARVRPVRRRGVIGPWNYPVFTPMGSIAHALRGGQRGRLQAVGAHPAVGQWLVRTFRKRCRTHRCCPSSRGSATPAPRCAAAASARSRSRVRAAPGAR